MVVISLEGNYFSYVGLFYLQPGLHAWDWSQRQAKDRFADAAG
jgi:hypothetical protein